MPHSGAPTISVPRRAPPLGDADHTVVWVRGEHDIATKVSLAVAIARAAQRDDAPLLVDLSGVTFMDASTVGAIVGSRNRLGSRGQSLELRAPSALALRVIGLCGLTDLIRRDPVHATGASAALRSWVDVPTIEASERVDHETAPLARHATVGQPLELPTPDPTRDGAVQAVGADRIGP
jgi:anti-anti-sigma factor